MSRFGRYGGESKVYVGNLGTGAGKAELERAFGYYGPLRTVWIARNPPGFAFVEFEDSRDAEDAVRGLDGKVICGSRVRVEPSNGMPRRSRYERPPPRRPFDPDDKCYECGQKGHYAYDCHRYGRRGHRSRSRSRSRSRGRRYSRSRSRSRSRGRRSRSSPRRSRSSTPRRSRSGSPRRSRSGSPRRSRSGSPRRSRSGSPRRFRSGSPGRSRSRSRSVSKRRSRSGSMGRSRSGSRARSRSASRTPADN